MPPTTSGLHHVTAIAGPTQQNVDFFAGLLALRLVKQTVNFDDPGTYHLYYGDAQGRPGTILTFFPWAHAAPGRAGAGLTSETAFRAAPGTLDAWATRLAEADVQAVPCTRFGETCLTFSAPDGLPLAIVEADASAGDAPGPDAAPRLQGFHGVTLQSGAPDETAAVLADVLGYRLEGEEDGRRRFTVPGDGPGTRLDLVAADRPGRPGAGTVHHIAFRARDDDDQRAWRERVAAAGLHVTDVKDRQYFRSIYFREPGGILFEIATDPPGFGVDEPPEALGRSLQLPPWLEPHRARLEAQLPALSLPAADAPDA